MKPARSESDNHSVSSAATSPGNQTISSSASVVFALEFSFILPDFRVGDRKPKANRLERGERVFVEALKLHSRHNKTSSSAKHIPSGNRIFWILLFDWMFQHSDLLRRLQPKIITNSFCALYLNMFLRHIRGKEILRASKSFSLSFSSSIRLLNHLQLPLPLPLFYVLFCLLRVTRINIRLHSSTRGFCAVFISLFRLIFSEKRTEGKGKSLFCGVKKGK